MSDVTAAKKPRGTDDVPVPPTLRKSLKNRHIQLIALGGAIGTGLFYGSSESIQLAGPSILLAYLVGGLAIFMIVRALSEMSVEDPKAGAFSYYATRYWSRRAGFISGWNYWFNYILVSMVELSVVGSFDSIVDGLILNARISAPVHAECTRCLKPIQRDWTVNVTSFFPYEDKSAAGKGGKAGKNGKEEEVDIIAGEDEAEDTYPLLDGGAWADLEALLRDTLVEELPLQPLCKPDCKGLCSQCGIDLNENPDHQHDMTDIRFAALEGLKAKLEGKE